MAVQTTSFTQGLPVRSDFIAVLDGNAYQRAPDDWLIALTDVVASRRQIATGRYKAVNMAGVAMISALLNTLETRDVPFIFSGDGAAIIFAPADRATVERTLAATVTWVKEELELDLRAAIVPIAVVRADGHDLLVQASRVSGAVTSYAFRGGGLSHAEALMKAGRFAVPAAPAGTRPDLTGLTCRWSPIRSEGESIVSIIMEAREEAEQSFPERARALLDLVGMHDGRSRTPATLDALNYGWPPANLEMETRAYRGHSSKCTKFLLFCQSSLGWLLFRTGLPLGGFDPRRYKEFTSLNTDYRKFQDGLRITVSLGETELRKLTEFLEEGRAAGHVRYGLCVQDSAILTCYVPSLTSDSHFHFLDGAGGGYAQAAENMKS